jgi:hypothetical protein
MEWNQAMFMSCAAVAFGSTGAGVFACGWFLRAASERALRADYRALFHACEKSIRAASTSPSEGLGRSARSRDPSCTARGLDLLDGRRKLQRENRTANTPTSSGQASATPTRTITVRQLILEEQAREARSAGRHRA